MTQITEIPKYARNIPQDIKTFIHHLQEAQTILQKQDPDASLLNVALFLHDFYLGLNYRMYLETRNHAHIWSCLNDLSGISASYFFLTKTHQDKTFLKPLPDWLLDHIASAAINLHGLILKSEKASEKFIRTPRQKISTSIVKKIKNKPSKNRERITFNNEIRDLIPQELNLITQGRNRIILAGNDRKIFKENSKYIAEGRDPITAAMLAHKHRIESLTIKEGLDVETDEKPNMHRANQSMRKTYRIWGIDDTKRPRRVFPIG